MKITLNGNDEEIAAATLAELCEKLGLADAKIATALNGKFVPRGNRANQRLHENDQIEIVSPRQGG